MGRLRDWTFKHYLPSAHRENKSTTLGRGASFRLVARTSFVNSLKLKGSSYTYAIFMRGWTLGTKLHWNLFWATQKNTIRSEDCKTYQSISHNFPKIILMTQLLGWVMCMFVSRRCVDVYIGFHTETQASSIASHQGSPCLRIRIRQYEPITGSWTHWCFWDTGRLIRSSNIQEWLYLPALHPSNQLHDLMTSSIWTLITVTSWCYTLQRILTIINGFAMYARIIRIYHANI